MRTLTLGTPGVTNHVHVQTDPADGTQALIGITLTSSAAEDLVEALTGSRPDLSALPGVPLPPMPLSKAENAAIAAWNIRHLLETTGTMPAEMCLMIGDTFTVLGQALQAQE